MSISLAFIDCFIETPANLCFNDFAISSNFRCTYHMPSKYGFDSLMQLKGVDGYIILGSASHVSDKLTWHKELLDFIIPKIESNIGVLGICFGHQLLANYYGCELGFINDSQEVYNELRQTQVIQDELGFKKGETLSLAYSHAQVVTNISKNMISFARSSRSLYEGLKHKDYNLWTVQSHPEASHNFLKQINSDSLNHDGFRILDNFTKLLAR